VTEDELGVSPGKIFGIGLSRTGTTSLHAAAILLGLPAVHPPAAAARQWLTGDFSPATVARFSVYSDLPVAIYFRELDRICPNAKFILTTRDPAAWIDSVERYFASSAPSSPRTLLRDMIRIAAYGTMTFHKPRFIDVFHRHADSVADYFADRPGDLLTIDIGAEADPWRTLCGFVGTAIPECSFPHFTTPEIGDLSAVLPGEAQAKRQRLIAFLKAQPAKDRPTAPPATR